MRKKLILIILSVCLMILAGIYFVYVNANKNPDYEYRKLEDGTVELYRYHGDDPIVHIPEKVKGKPVTRIGDYCFKRDGYTPEYQVYIPDTVRIIGGEAFWNCKNLTISGGKNVEKIEGGAFTGCSFTDGFPYFKSLKYIGNCAFLSVEYIGRIRLSDQLEYIGSCAFDNIAGLEEIEIPQSVSYIGDYAFVHTSWYEKQEGYVVVGDGILIKYPYEEIVVMPEGTKRICLSDFPKHENIREIYIPRTVQYIDTPLVSQLTDKLTVYLPDSIERVEEDDHLDNGIAFENTEYVTCVVEKGSYAEEYAKEMAEKCGSSYRVVDRIVYPE